MLLFQFNIRKNRSSTKLCIRAFIFYNLHQYLLQETLYDVKLLVDYTYIFLFVNCKKTSVSTLNSNLLKAQD